MESNRGVGINIFSFHLKNKKIIKKTLQRIQYVKKELAKISLAELLLKDRELHTPKTGYELVGIDDFEFFGEQLYTLGQFNTLNEVLSAKHKIKNQVNCVIYDSKGNVFE